MAQKNERKQKHKSETSDEEQMPVSLDTNEVTQEETTTARCSSKGRKVIEEDSKPSSAANSHIKNVAKARKKGKQLAAKKSADHKQHLKRQQKSGEEINPIQGQSSGVQEAEGKYDYLDKKDWDRYVLDEPDNFTAEDLRKAESYKLSELSEINNNLPYDKTDFSETQKDFSTTTKTLPNC